MSNPTSFDVSRGKDENEIIKQLTQAYNMSLLQSNQTLHPVDINASFSCVEALYMDFKNKLSDEYIIKIFHKIKEYKTEYTEAMGIKNKSEGVDRGSLEFLNNLNEKVKDIFLLVMDGLNKEK